MRPLPRSITLDRSGYVKVRVGGSSHCGAAQVVKDGQITVKYTVRLTVGPNDLDDRGFMVDQEGLHQVMVDIGAEAVPWHESCEMLSFVWGERVLAWIRGTNTRLTVHSFDFTLSPEPHAGAFTAHFEERQLSNYAGLVAVA